MKQRKRVRYTSDRFRFSASRVMPDQLPTLGLVRDPLGTVAYSVARIEILLTALKA